MAFGLGKLFSTFTHKSAMGGTSVVGIDVGTASVKIVEVVDQNQSLRLSTYGELQLGPYAGSPLGECVSLPVDKRTEAVIDVLRESNSHAQSAVFSLQSSQSFVTSVLIEAGPEEDLSARVPVEARKVIPVPLAEVALEWVEVPSLPNTPVNSREVLVAAIQKTALAENKQIISSLQKKKSVPEIEVFSVIRSLSQEGDKALAILDLGAKINKIYIVEDGFLRQIHRVQAGGAMATKRIAELLSVEFEAAENIKRNFDLTANNAADIQKAVLSTYERTLQEFKRALTQYERRSGGQISRLVVTGGSVLFPNLLQSISYVLDRKVELADPFKKVSYPAFMEDTVKEIGPTFSVAIGGALRSFE